ncbi:MAG: alpha-ketoacid dehydrogenase subunit beta [Planctomycetota bacterium]|nr:MAG: alpha-ketoacid dehydrogenase subunit beta [Planctomycetota bacterium]
MEKFTPERAIVEAIREEMERDDRVIFFGEGVATKHYELVKEFGKERIRNVPLAEGIIVGTAVGASATGLRPIVDILFAPFITYAMEEFVNSAGKLRYISGGQFSFPLVVMGMTGGGWCVGAHHNHNIESWFIHAPGIYVVMPSAARDFKGLLKSSIRDENPVFFFIDIGLLHMPGEVPEQEYTTPLGKAKVILEGEDITLISWGKTVYRAVEAAEELAKEGIQIEVMDLMTLKPLDQESILNSVSKTNHLVVVHEASRNCGFGAEIAAIVSEEAFEYLKGPVVRVTGPDAPPPSSYVLEQAFAPDKDKIIAGVKRALGV